MDQDDIRFPFFPFFYVPLNFYVIPGVVCQDSSFRYHTTAGVCHSNMREVGRTVSSLGS